MGKPASGQIAGNVFHHYDYNETTDTWVNDYTGNIDGAPTSNGHIWAHAYDPATGDYYIIVNNRDSVWRWDYTSKTWVETPDMPLVNASSAPMGWHPNLFGQGDGGVIVRNTRGSVAWRRSTNLWQIVQTASSGDPNWERGGGADYAYFPSDDTVFVGSGNGSNSFRQGQIFNAGSAGIADTNPVQTPDHPLLNYGAGAGGQAMKIVEDPIIPERLIGLETRPAWRIWTSTDHGLTWTLQSGAHPFQNLGDAAVAGGNNQWTCGSLPVYNVIWGLYSGHDGGGADSLLWRPDI
jgi:hypothetical protein